MKRLFMRGLVTVSGLRFCCLLSFLFLFLLFSPAPVFAATRYVSFNGSHTLPFTNWTMAATNIQAAIDAAVAGDTVLVTNGTYATGGKVVHGAMTNRVAIDKPITVRSVNGPEETFIVGNGPNGDAAVRCVYIAHSASLVGFTLTNGHTRTSGFDYERRGGGVLAPGVWGYVSGIVSNCILTGNSAASMGGGSYDGILKNCVLEGNTAPSAGGAYYGTLYNCTLTRNSATSGGGGGAYDASLYSCTLRGNTANTYGGGYRFGIVIRSVINCIFTGNTASSGGGAYGGSFINCVFTRNTAKSLGGGVYGGISTNCTIAENTATTGGGACAKDRIMGEVTG